MSSASSGVTFRLIVFTELYITTVLLIPYAEWATNAIAGVLNGTLSGTRVNLLLKAPTKGSDGVVNGNWTVVTEQVITLGLPNRVVNAIPLEGVRFDEATGEGPGDIFSDFLDFLLDAAAFVVQGLLLRDRRG